MKKLILLFACSFILLTATAQKDIVGNWTSVSEMMGQKIKIIFHIKKENQQYTATFDSPDQGAFGLVCGKVSLVNDSLYIELTSIKGTYKGKWNKADEITGTINQGTNLAVANFQRSANANVAKPQTPKPPFNYTSEEVEYENTTQNVHLGATLTKPNGEGKFPVVIMITGSGQQDRDETIGLHKPFWVIADYLTQQGIAVLRVDDRGKGKSTGNFAQSSSADFATDVMAGIDYLKSRKDIDTKHIGLIGHSEGGIIAPYVAAMRKDVNFIVSLAGPAIGGKATNDFQNILPLKNAGIEQVYIDSFLVLHHNLVNASITIKEDSLFKTAIKEIYNNWKNNQSDKTKQILIRGKDEQVIKSFQQSYAAFRNSWWRFFLTYEPTKDIQKLSCAVLVLNGEKDEQVESKPNLTAFETALKKSKTKHYKIIEVLGVNHLFQHCKQCGSVQEYIALEETFDIEALTTISNWINETVK
jgi:dienelactone hydrolase